MRDITDFRTGQPLYPPVIGESAGLGWLHGYKATTTTRAGGFLGHVATPIARWMVLVYGKSQSKMDDDWGYPYDLGNLCIREDLVIAGNYFAYICFICKMYEVWNMI